MKSSDKITAHWSATIIRGPSVMVESTVAGGLVTNPDGTINKARTMKAINGAIDAAKNGNVVQISFTIQPR